MRVLLALVTGWLPGRLTTAAARVGRLPLRPERRQPPGPAADRFDAVAVNAAQRLHPATAALPGPDGQRALRARCTGLADTLRCRRDTMARWLLGLLLCSSAIGHAATVEYLVVGGGGGGGRGACPNAAASPQVTFVERQLTGAVAP